MPVVHCGAHLCIFLFMIFKLFFRSLFQIHANNHRPLPNLGIPWHRFDVSEWLGPRKKLDDGIVEPMNAK
jgi:hypothetical protein